MSSNPRSGRTSTSTRQVKEGLEEAVADLGDPTKVQPEDVEGDLGTVVEGTDGVKKVLVSYEWLQEVEERLARAERPVLVKAKDLVVENRRKLVLAGTTVAAVAAAAYVATHREEVAHALEETVEKTSEKVEHGANDVKQDARKARTGSRTK